MSHLIFVYGTLRLDEMNHNLMREAKLIAAQAFTAGELWDTGNGYPAVIRSENSTVYGELYRVHDETLKRLDALECYHGPNDQANHYERIEQMVTTDEGTYAAEIYIYTDPPVHGERIRSGDWKREKVEGLDSILYFAYGSCMDDVRFESAGVNHLFSKMIGRGVLQDYALAFGYEASDGYGRADIVERKGQKVEGKIYAIDQEALEYLFVREGVASQIYRPVIVRVENGGEILANVLTFTVIDKLEGDVPPPGWYMDEILRGAKGTVSDEYVRELQERFQEYYFNKK